jgi:N-acetyl-gamma-glutamyl-phosphate reductase
MDIPEASIMKQNTQKAAIIGASGYSGVELVKLLSKHPKVDIACVMGHSTVGKRVDDIYPYFRQKLDLVIEPYELAVVKDMDIVFLALPHGQAMQRVPELVEVGKRVIDFSGDFRLTSADEYQQWYNLPHTAESYLKRAVYGMPELFREEICDAQLIANPGCYPTGSILALAPLMTKAYVNLEAIAITAMSGTSGAGRKEKLDLIFSEVNESVKAYRVGNHQHTPEIRSVLEQVAGRGLNVVFIPHLLPITRGIYTTISLPLKEAVSRETVLQDYVAFYQSAPFVRVLEDRPPEMKFISGTNYCDIGVAIDQTQRFLTVTTAIDNLVKGAAGQAVQNMNLMLGYDETEGLI